MSTRRMASEDVPGKIPVEQVGKTEQRESASSMPLEQERWAEVINFGEASVRIRAKRFKEKILHDAKERYGEIGEADSRVEMLRRVHARLLRILPDLPKGKVSFLGSPDINAFAVKADVDVFVHDGLLRQYVTWCVRNRETPSEDAFAFVVAHELGHIRQGSQEIDLQEQENVEKKEDEKTEDGASKHQRRLNNEYDADRFGLQVMADAGYNPREGLKMLRFLESFHDGIDLPITHPRSADRLRELIALVESPDTIIQHTDTSPTPLSESLAKELSSEDLRRPGTALYRAEARKNLGQFILAAETVPDMLEPIQVAQMHRRLEEINRLRGNASVRDLYAKYLVVDNVRQVLNVLERTYTQMGGRTFGVVMGGDMPTNTTRYVMREYGYERAVPGEESEDTASFDADIADMLKQDVDRSIRFVHDSIQQELDRLSTRLQIAREGTPQHTGYLVYQEKLEYLRDHLASSLQTVDQSVLSDMAKNADVDPKTEWSGSWETRKWIEKASSADILAWCRNNGSSLFSQLVHPLDVQMQQAVGTVLGKDSRYEAYLPPSLTAQEDFSSLGGRAAFLEQALFARIENIFTNDVGRSEEHERFLTRTASSLETLRLPLAAALEVRYAGVANAEPLAKAMAHALLSDDLYAGDEVENLVVGFSDKDAQVWLATIEPVLSGYRPSANQLFLSETGLQSNVLHPLLPDVYKKFYRLESLCVQNVRRSRLTREDESKAWDRLLEEIALGDTYVRNTSIQEVGNVLRRESWSEARAKDFEARLTPILQLLQPEERLRLLNQVLGTGHNEMPNLVEVISYTVGVCEEYAEWLLKQKWEEFLAHTSEETRIPILKNVYAHAEKFGGLGKYVHNRTFSYNLATTYLEDALSQGGDDAFIEAFAALAKQGHIHGELGKPVFNNTEIQERLEQLSDEMFLQIALAYKRGGEAGAISDALHNSFALYVTRRVLGIYGAQGFDPMRLDACQFDMSRPFVEVFGGIKEYVLPYYASLVQEACIKAYGKSPLDIVLEGADQFYSPIPVSVVRGGGQAFEGVSFEHLSVDSYANRYDPSAPSFFEKQTYERSPRREAIEAFVRETGLVQDREKSGIERFRIVLELVPESTNYRDVLFGEIEADMRAEHGVRTNGHQLLLEEGGDRRAIAAMFYDFYVHAIGEMTDQARMQLWGRRAETLYREHLSSSPRTLSDELVRLQTLFPAASFARDEALYALGNTSLIQTPEQARRIQSLLSEFQRQTHDTEDLANQSQLERFNLVIGNLSRLEKKDFILWTIGAAKMPPKTLRAYGAFHKVSMESIPDVVFAATAQEREQFLLRLFVGSNGLFDSQTPEDLAVVETFVAQAFDHIFPDDEETGVSGQPREILRSIFTTVLTEYDAYRRGKIFIGMLEALQARQDIGRGEKIVTLMSELGPVFIKVGQVLSETEVAPGEYLLPEDVRIPMKGLKQSAKRFHRLAGVFSLETTGEFDPGNPHRIVAVEETLAAASIKQVNAAVRADGKRVVEKVLRPSIEKHLQEDVRVLGTIVERLRTFTTVPKGIEEIGATYVREESDFAREVRNTKKIRKALDLYRTRSVVQTMPVRTTEVYTFSKTHIQEEQVRGISLEELTRVAEDPAFLDVLTEKYRLTSKEQTTYREMAQDVPGIRLQAFDALVFQYFQAEAFHSDPHGGNLFLTPEKALVMIDNGSIGETTQANRNDLKKFFLGFALRQSGELRAAVNALAQGLESRDLDEVVTIAEGPLGEADKMNHILTTVSERATSLDPSFDKFLKSFATGAYLMSGLKPDDVRAILGAYTQGDSGSLRSYAASAVTRAAREYPDSFIGRTARKFIGE